DHSAVLDDEVIAHRFLPGMPKLPPWCAPRRNISIAIRRSRFASPAVTAPTPARRGSEFQQVVAQMAVLIGLPYQAAALQLGHQPVAHFHDVAAVEVGIEDQETVTAHLLHDL